MREELIKQIWDKFGCKCGCGNISETTSADDLADFVIKKMEESCHD